MAALAFQLSLTPNRATELQKEDTKKQDTLIHDPISEYNQSKKRDAGSGYRLGYPVDEHKRYHKPFL